MGFTSPRYVWVVVANTLSFARLVCAAVFPFVPGEDRHWRLALVAFAAATDLIDGQIARRMHAQTRLGQALDAVADKAMALVVILTLALEGELEWWWVLLLAARDIAVVLATLVLFQRHRMEASQHMSHHFSGKLATAAAFVLLVALLAWPRQDTLHWGLLSVAAATSLFAGARIFFRLPGMLRGDSGSEPAPAVANASVPAPEPD